MGEYGRGGWGEEWGGGGERGKRSRREVVKVEKEKRFTGSFLSGGRYGVYGRFGNAQNLWLEWLNEEVASSKCGRALDEASSQAGW